MDNNFSRILDRSEIKAVVVFRLWYIGRCGTVSLNVSHYSTQDSLPTTITSTSKHIYLQYKN
jgi:hypothetical protein